MRQKLLFFISVVMLNAASICFAEDDLPDLPPPLPTASAEEESVLDENISDDGGSDTGEQKSFFDKMKNFFGFASDDAEDKKSDNSEAELVEENEAIAPPAEPIISAEDMVKASDQKQLEVPDSSSVMKFQSESEPEAPEPEASLEPSSDLVGKPNHAIFSSSRARPEDTSDLALPEGFAEFAEEQPKKEEVAQVEKTVATVEADGGAKEEAKSEPKIIITQNPEKELLLPVKEEASAKDQKLSEELGAGNNSQNGDELEEKPADFVDNSVALKLDESKSLDSKKFEEIKVATPDYVAEAGNKSIIDKYKAQLEKNKSDPKRPEQIAEGELVIDNAQIENFTEVTAADLDNATLEFVNNEAQVLLLPDDDVVEGRLTQEAKYNMMDLRSYIKLFWSKYNKEKKAYAAYEIDEFIDDYESEVRVDYSSKDVVEALTGAFKAVDSGNTDSLIALLNAYPILQLSGPGGNNLLHEAAYVGNYSAAKLLILKGINLHARNAKKQTAMSVAKKAGNKEIIALLKSAGARKKRYINFK